MFYEEIKKKKRKDYSIFSLPVWIYRKSYCTTLFVVVGVGRVGGIGMDKMLKFYGKVLYDEQGIVRQAILCVDRSCCHHIHLDF